jgi:hypothetical protein
LGGLLVGIYNAATNEADTRAWTALPNDFQMARFARPENGHLTIRHGNNNQPLLELDLPKSKHVLVYIKMTMHESDPVYWVLNMEEGNKQVHETISSTHPFSEPVGMYDNSRS